MTHVVLVDNQDSFVYNLVDAFAVAGYQCTVFRNTVSVEEILAANPDLICLSPGPGHPLEAGNMMKLIAEVIGKVPILGICLGFQALLEHFGGEVVPCGPVHGTTDNMVLEEAGQELFGSLTTDAGLENNFRGTLVPVARYHSLGCVNPPEQLAPMGTCDSAIGRVVMAAKTTDNMAIGLQFHPESVLSPAGPIILDRCIELLISQKQGSAQ
ncbi:anthranilate synthase component II [Corynebacterium sp. 153RC1]|uniref:anthranilate synthase component II n=1 Tax=unclassified Corynebacterium TaxID=2624378 RepID=UPI00211C1C77|nr:MULTISPECIES: anthranilate synthase component II [unclassified Corynebacterium]MCQ9352780.1 anthranilate synthase component II [Corynebacterium sp. 209RC1]MCQ9354964.1 anthranilate synthase component II [Corynebacterium sp. 1222RC1]MCQ9357225.1 anthranilate synthase component II [Corynebacterium sp. 122RC1]MCQ9359400.1 anthranilate synthase component II [Corynebacterium sp. 142RC1]MCQ9361622.1 anthranilate synthase component II [Corynebacterium sp. 153RC1]